jgi:hypothetical protein
MALPETNVLFVKIHDASFSKYLVDGLLEASTTTSCFVAAVCIANATGSQYWVSINRIRAMSHCRTLPPYPPTSFVQQLVNICRMLIQQRRRQTTDAREDGIPSAWDLAWFPQVVVVIFVVDGWRSEATAVRWRERGGGWRCVLHEEEALLGVAGLFVVCCFHKMSCVTTKPGRTYSYFQIPANRIHYSPSFHELDKA